MMALYMPMQPSSKTPMIALFGSELLGEFAAEFRSAGFGNFEIAEAVDVAGRHDGAGGRSSQRRSPSRKNVVLKSATPEGAVLHAGFGQRAVEVQHADESRPLAAPVGDGQDGASMGEESGEHVMAVLPDGFDDDQRSIRAGSRGRLPCRSAGCR